MRTLFGFNLFSTCHASTGLDLATLSKVNHGLRNSWLTVRDEMREPRKCTLSVFASGLALALSIPLTAFAGPGGMDSGGGEPYANQFLQIGRFFETTQRNNPIAGVEVNSKAIKRALDKIEMSLEGEPSKRLVLFPPGETVNCEGIPLLGCVASGKIQFARQGWENASMEEKIEVSALEIAKVLELKDRYKTAAKVRDALAKKLVLTDGVEGLPRTSEVVKSFVLKELNQPKNKLREIILQVQYESCQYSGCQDDGKPYRFKSSDLLGLIDLGSSWSVDGCKSDCSDSEEHHTRHFLVAIKVPWRLRWSVGDDAIVLEAKFTRSMHTESGRLRYSKELTVHENPKAEHMPAD
jgi:hypothetical protein